MATTTVFSGPPTASQTFGSLRLADSHSNGRHRSRRDRSRVKRTPDSDTLTIMPREQAVVKLTGYNKYAITAIKAASPSGDDFLEAPWTEMDTVMALMKRIENEVCIPSMYWRLAGGGKVLDPSASTATHPLFLRSQTIDLVLVPLSAIEQYIDEQSQTLSSLPDADGRSANGEEVT